ncbi:hypothetical protein KCP77_03615 [Salmonella enterica subsp. enterica]|nr:hypothetical protein KCP77_03615 [Salmonella enterica subsp. enterica]
MHGIGALPNRTSSCRNFRGYSGSVRCEYRRDGSGMEGLILAIVTALIGVRSGGALGWLNPLWSWAIGSMHFPGNLVGNRPFIKHIGPFSAIISGLFAQILLDQLIAPFQRLISFRKWLCCFS